MKATLILRPLLALLCCALALRAEEKVLSVAKFSSWPPLGVGGVSALVVDGTHAYLAEEDGVSVVDISNPATPVEVSKIPGKPWQLAVRDNLVYFTDAHQKLNIYDVTNPANPSRVGQGTLPASTFGLALYDHYAVVGQFGDLEIVDVADPADPILVNSIQRSVRTLKVVGRYTYLGNENGLEVVDLIDPQFPKLVGLIAVGYVKALAVQGSFVYALFDQKIKVVDVSDPRNPTLATTLTGDTYFEAIGVAGDYLCAERQGAFEVYDVHSPGAPTRIFSGEEWNGAGDITISGHYAYVSDGEARLRILDIADPAAPKSVYDLDGSTRAILFAAPYLYVAENSQTPKFRVLDATDLAHPKQVAELGGFSINEMTRQGSFIYALGREKDLRIIDVSNPTNPKFAGIFPTEKWATTLTVQGNYGYLASYFTNLSVLDLSNPASPRLVGSYPTTNTTVAVSGSWAFAGTFPNTIQVLDISNPATPILANTVSSAGLVSAFAIAGTNLLAGSARGLEVFDIADPAHPRSTGEFVVDPSGSGFGPRRVSIKGQVAILSDMEYGYLFIDFGDPTRPQFAGRIWEGNLYATSADVSGDFIALGYDWRRVELFGARELPAERPKLVNEFKMPAGAWGQSIAVSKSVGYITRTDGALLVVGLNSSEVIKRIDLPSPGVPVVSGNLLAVTLTYDGFNLYDISNPRDPKPVGEVRFDFPAGSFYEVHDLKIFDQFALVSVMSFGFYPDLMIYDISNPAAPKFRGGYRSMYEATSLAVRGRTAALVTQHGLEIINWSDETNPRLVAQYLDAGGSDQAALWSNYAFLAGNGDEVGGSVRAFDLASGTPIPAGAGLIGLGLPMRDLVVTGSRIYLSGFGLQVLDANATWLGGSDIATGGTQGLAIEDDRAYVIRDDNTFLTYQLTSLPILEATRTGNSLTLRWPDRFMSYKLYSAPAASGPWREVTGGIVLLDGYKSRSLPISPDGPSFFKLGSE
jgi:hypothetical protein